LGKKNQINIILDNIRSALNVGAIFRTCDAANISKLHLCGITAYPPHNKIPKTALGATKTVSWKHYQSTEKAVIKSKNLNYKIISVELTPKSINFWDYNFEQPLSLIFGNEITGISKEILNLSDSIIKVPMFGSKKSLNVATTCGIVLYEVLRKINILKE